MAWSRHAVHRVPSCTAYLTSSVIWFFAHCHVCSWYGEFNGGVELSGCAGGGRPFAKDAAMEPEALAGAWQADAGQSYTYVASDGGQMELAASTGAQPGASLSGYVPGRRRGRR